VRYVEAPKEQPALPPAKAGVAKMSARESESEGERLGEGSAQAKILWTA